MIEDDVAYILNSHLKGIRNAEQTSKNLASLYTTLNEEEQSLIRTQLRVRYVLEIQRGTDKDAVFEHGKPEITRAISDFLGHIGDAGGVASMILNTFPLEFSGNSKFWGDVILLDLYRMINTYPEQLEFDVFDRVKKLVTVSAKLSIPLVVTSRLVELDKCVDRVRFEQFERRLASQLPVKPDSKAQTALPEAIRDALDDARQKVLSDGPFAAKNAGDQVRSCIDDCHRWIVAELSQRKNVEFKPNSQNDSERRKFMLELNFINEAEKKFVGNIYSFISEEVSHTNQAPKETILLFLRVVPEYLELIATRLRNSS